MKKAFLVLFVAATFGLYALSEVAVSEIKAEVLVRSSEMWDGTPLPDYPKGNPEITILKVIVPPGAKLPIHRHPVINAGYMLSGELTVNTAAGGTKHLKAGDTLIEVVDKWHYGENTGEETAEIIVFYAGEKGVPLSVKKDTGPAETKE